MKPDGAPRCRSCGGANPREAHHCAHCGRTIAHRERRDHEAPVECPRCHTPALFIGLGSINVDHCTGCGGAWFDDGELESLPEALSETEAAEEAARALGALAPARLPDEPLAVRYLSCPVCREIMNRRNYQQISGIILNRCDGHGAWLDLKNTLRLLRLIAEGRLREIEQRARTMAAADLRRHLGELELARQRLLWEPRPSAPRRPTGVREIVWALLDFWF